jgi:hypothetical protein
MKWIFATLFFGFFTVMFCVLFSADWHDHAAGVTFTASHSGRGGFTTLGRPHFSPLARLIIVCNESGRRDKYLH